MVEVNLKDEAGQGIVEHLKYQYERAWLKIPVQPGRFYHVDKHVFACLDITKQSIRILREHVFKHFNKSLTMAYTDPPWNAANLTCFVNKAQAQTLHNFTLFLDELLLGLKENVAGDSYIEMGIKNTPLLKTLIENTGGIVLNDIPIRYYRTRGARLIRCKWDEQTVSFIRQRQTEEILKNMDDKESPYMAILNSSEKGAYVLDPCVGLGATAISAMHAGRYVAAADLNPKRLAYTLMQVLGRAYANDVDPKIVEIEA